MHAWRPADDGAFEGYSRISDGGEPLRIGAIPCASPSMGGDVDDDDVGLIGKEGIGAVSAVGELLFSEYSEESSAVVDVFIVGTPLSSFENGSAFLCWIDEMAAAVQISGKIELAH